MSKVVVFMNLTLDGVMQAPGRPDEDRRGGFEHGGWAMPYATEEPLPWSNSTLLKGDAAEAVARLKEEPDKDLVILGSGELVQSLMRRNLVDEYVLLIHPLVLGSGRRLFADGGAFAALRLVATRTTTTGVVIATYQLAETTARKTADSAMH